MMPPRSGAAESRRFTWTLLALTAVVLTARWLTAPEVVEHFDGAAFVLGVERYATAEQRPFATGYPVYIWLGKLFALWSDDRVAALHALSVWASTLTLWPLALLARAWRFATGGSTGESHRAGVAAALLWSASPLSWTVGTEIWSDPTALCVGLLMLWACWLALQPGPRARLWLLCAAGLGGWMLGVRLGYATLLLPVGYAVLVQAAREGKSSWPRLLPMVAGAFVLPVGIWAGWQWSREGFAALEAARQHLGGHYGSWGGSLATDPDPWSRPTRLAQTLFASGFGSWWPSEAPWRGLASVAVALLGAAGSRRLWLGPDPHPRRLAVLWGLPYLIGVLVNHDLSFPRYLLPLVALLCPLLALGLPSHAGRARLVTALATAVMLSVSVPRAQRHGEAPRVGYEVTRFVRESLDPGGDALLITGEGQYLAFFLTRDAPAHVLRIVPLSALSAETERLESEGWRVYATAPAPDQPGGWQPVARLCRGDKPADARDPDEVWIFQHRPGAPRAGFPECS